MAMDALAIVADVVDDVVVVGTWDDSLVSVSVAGVAVAVAVGDRIVPVHHYHVASWLLGEVDGSGRIAVAGSLIGRDLILDCCC